MNGAALVAEILKREGTEFISCYPRNPVIEECAKLGIRPILCRQERVGVGIADGYTRIMRGKVNGVFAAQAGPGIENAFPGVAQAFSENVPMLILPGGLASARQYRHPTFSAVDVFARRLILRLKGCFFNHCASASFSIICSCLFKRYRSTIPLC